MTKLPRTNWAGIRYHKLMVTGQLHKLTTELLLSFIGNLVNTVLLSTCTMNTTQLLNMERCAETMSTHLKWVWAATTSTYVERQNGWLEWKQISPNSVNGAQFNNEDVHMKMDITWQCAKYITKSTNTVAHYIQSNRWYRTCEYYQQLFQGHCITSHLTQHTHLDWPVWCNVLILFLWEELLSAFVRVHYYQHSITTHCTSVCSGNSNSTRADMTRLSVIVTTVR